MSPRPPLDSDDFARPLSSRPLPGQAADGAAGAAARSAATDADSDEDRGPEWFLAHHTPELEEFPRDLRSVDRTALAIFGRLRRRSAADRLHVWRAAQRVVGEGTGRPSDNPKLGRRAGRGVRLTRDELQAAALEAALACIEDVGHLPSAPGYRRWRKADPARAVYLADAAMARAFGGWSRLREAVGQHPRFDPASMRLLTLGHFFTKEELIECVRACARSTRVPWLSFEQDYRPYAKDQMGRPVADRDRPRFPLSRGPFDSHGGWAVIQVAAGLNDPYAGREDGRPPLGLNLGPAADLSREAIIEALREFAVGRKPSQLTEAAFKAHRRQLTEEALAEGRLLARIGPARIRTYFDSFPAALHAAGVIDDDDLSRRLQRVSKEFTDGELEGALRTVAEELGSCFGSRAYRRVRRRLLEENADNAEFVFPCHDTVARRLGGGNFDEAVRVVLRPTERPGGPHKSERGRPAKEGDQ